MKRRKLISLIIVFCLTAGMTGCGQEQVQESAAESITLLDPVGLAGNGEEAAFRNLYDAKVYSATVVPYVEEYCFEEDITLEEFHAFPGETVKKGEILAASSTENLDKQIENLQEQIQKMEEDFAEYEKETKENLTEPQEEVKRLESIVENLEKQKPAKYLESQQDEQPDEQPDEPQGSVSGSDAEGIQKPEEEPEDEPEEKPEEEPVINPAYSQWEQEYNRWNGQYRIKNHSINTVLLQLEQRTALYELDHEYALQQLAFLQDKKSDVTIHAGISGEVVALGELGYGDWIQGETPIIAVGDPQQKLLKCDYINKATASKAEEIYAFIDGKRYEITYVPIETEEYTRLTAQEEEVFTTFYLEGDTEEIGLGDYAAIVVVNERREHALSVPKEAIHKDDTGSYVYLIQGDENVYTSVRTGMSDGVYTEILSGLNEGDMVLLDQSRQYSDQHVTVEKGSFHSDFSGSGIMYYPSGVLVQNPIEKGTVYFQEFETSLYEHVEKGDVIATVRVAADEIALQRLKTQLQRQQERLQDLIAAGEENNQKAIESRRQSIADLEEQIAEMEKDFQTTTIKATHSGIVIWTADLEKEDILQLNKNLVEIADENTCYVILENKGNVLAYGNEVTVTYRDRQEQEKTTNGMVANVNRLSVSSKLQSEYAYVLLPPELISDMSVGTAGWGGWWNRARFGITAKLREMDDVLVVPRRAVRETDGRTYVNVVEADGTIVRRSFIAGGYDVSNYWVIEGLTEGMELCLE